MLTFMPSHKPQIMGILNVTPDSFSDGGCYVGSDALKRRIVSLVSEGADIIDIGGESTRPGAQAVSVEQELERVIPAIELVQSLTDIPISVDTYKAQVMAEALKYPIAMINDVNALQSPQALDVVVRSTVSVCLMHKQGLPKTMQQSPRYSNVVLDVIDFLNQRIQACVLAGIAKNRIVVDPGFGFGKTLEHNLTLFKRLQDFSSLGCPVLVGVSRKSMLGQLLGGLSVEQRMLPSVVAAVLAVQQGAQIVRVHDVKQTCDALTLLDALGL
ncbi:dihydropteroate synthase [Thiomicrospira microaerophila]|uniref:dihydropteroate synthase n=1 Tax=Thiomicrospira microaerophila TaxID=406020 RepID=UPI0005CAE305|nr:dihydropteroate synthase [Thiomicrospira microaerophila]